MTSREYEDQSSNGGIKLAVLHLMFERKKINEDIEWIRVVC
jgi:hypothetical protein